jgi:phage FluMu protein gp41
VVKGELTNRGSDPPARSMLRPASLLARSITVVGRIRGQVLVRNLKRVGRPARVVLPECSLKP